MPKTIAEQQKELDHPAMCDLLPVRDFLDNVMVRDDGSFVAGVRIHGAMTYFATDDDRNQLKFFLESLLLVIPEESMRLQFRYEVVQAATEMIDEYDAARTSSDPRVC